MANLIKALFSASDQQFMWRVKLQEDAQAFTGLMTRWQRPIERVHDEFSSLETSSFFRHLVPFCGIIRHSPPFPKKISEPNAGFQRYT